MAHISYGAPSAIVDEALDQEVNEPPTPNSLNDMLHKNGSYSYDNTTDSLEAISDAVTALNDLSAVEVNSEVDNALNTAVVQPPTANSMMDILHKDGSYTYDNTTDSLEALADALATVDANVDAILVDTGTTLDAAIATIDANVDAILVDTGTTLDGKINTIDTVVDSILDDTGRLPVGAWTVQEGTISVVSTGFGSTMYELLVSSNIYEIGAINVMTTATVPGDLTVTFTMEDTGGTHRNSYQVTFSSPAANNWFCFQGYDGGSDNAPYSKIINRDIKLACKWSTGGPNDVDYQVIYRRIS